MFSREREGGIVMIEGRITPSTGGMAGTTVCAKLPIVLIL